MISSLRGKATFLNSEIIEIEVNNVGYECRVKSADFKVGEEVVVHTFMAVSENDLRLFGFKNREELGLFKKLITVSGVGPKTGANIVWNGRVEEIIRAIEMAEVKYFEKIKGVGKKTAQRIIIDLKNKIGGKGEIDLTDGNDEGDEVYESLKQLGFERKEIEKVVTKMPKDLSEIEKKLEWCLQHMN